MNLKHCLLLMRQIIQNSDNLSSCDTFCPCYINEECLSTVNFNVKSVFQLKGRKVQLDTMEETNSGNNQLRISTCFYKKCFGERFK